MYSKLWSCCLHGIQGLLIETEVLIRTGLPAFHVVGLPDAAVREAAERVRGAIQHCGFQFPAKRITVNLAPADVRKAGAAFDLAIACAILNASGQWHPPAGGPMLVLGELALDGHVRGVSGVLAMVHAAKQIGVRHVMVPSVNAEEAGWVPDLSVIMIDHLNELHPARVHELRIRSTGSGNWPVGQTVFSHPKRNAGTPFKPDHGDAEINSVCPGNPLPVWEMDFADVNGQRHAKRALMAAAAGMHNIMLIGPPGGGKSMLASRLRTILPPMTREEALEVNQIHSAASSKPADHAWITERPFRQPHHGITLSALVGGGAMARPGEISLAHHGVLLLDEFPEFSRQSLEWLRQPLEDGELHVLRSRARVRWPARFLMAGTMNPCPCGFSGHHTEGNEATVKRLLAAECRCDARTVAKYQAKLSGPLADRIDLHIWVPAHTDRKDPKEHRMRSSEMAERVLSAFRRQQFRYRNCSWKSNSRMPPHAITDYWGGSKEILGMVQELARTFGWSERTFHRALRVSRTVADLEDQETVEAAHLAEAVQWRQGWEALKGTGLQ